MTEHEREDRDWTSDDLQETGNMTVSNLRGKTIISMDNGEKIGEVEDVYIDPQDLSIAGLAVSQGGFFDRDTQIVPGHNIDKWGKDAVLVRNAGVLRPTADVPERDGWLSAHDKINGLSLVNTRGERIGRINDLLLDNNGKIVAYQVSEGSGQSAFGGQTKEIPASKTTALGKDVAIIDLDV
jgi:uncharacterized protein YrrD